MSPCSCALNFSEFVCNSQPGALVYRPPDRSIFITDDGNGFLGLQSGGDPCRQSMQSSTRETTTGEKERITDKNYRKDDACGTFYFIHTSLTIDFTRAAIFRGFNKGGAAASGTRGIEEDISSN